MCGEKSAPRITSPVSWGSPPHVRGKGFCAVEIHCCCGITPACAGKSGTVGAVGNAIGDHPRMCGEKAAFQRLHLAMLGSPPHVRGKDLQRPRQHRGTGITPACAGKRFFSGLVSRVPWDHPRMCGEKLAFFVFCPYVLGSPPHVRGKALFIKNHFPFVGITPACAGKRCTCCYACPRPTDHPRTCGEKAVLDMCSCHSLGSPPHMRGKVHLTVRSSLRRGITPAHAGKRSKKANLLCGQRDHPRTCGEKTKKIP